MSKPHFRLALVCDSIPHTTNGKAIALTPGSSCEIDIVVDNIAIISAERNKIRRAPIITNEFQVAVRTLKHAIASRNTGKTATVSCTGIRCRP